MAFKFKSATSKSFVCFVFLVAFVYQSPSSVGTEVPKFAFSWLNDNNTFRAGESATISIKVLGTFENASLGKSDFRPTITVNEKMGNSSFISGVFLDTSGDTSQWRILFTPIRVGIFNVLINDDLFKVFDSSLHFQVIPGRIHPSVCIAYWLGLMNQFEAGDKATVVIAPRDAFGNNVSSSWEDLNPYNFTVSAVFANGSFADAPNVTHMGWNELGNIVIEFIAAKAGTLLLSVNGGNHSLNGSPLPFIVYAGPLDVSNCLAKWKFKTTRWQIYSKMEIFIHQQDQYGNLVPGLYEFDADVVQKETNLSIPVSDLMFKEVDPGIQLLSFSLLEPGNFLLIISDSQHNMSISNMPLAYTVFIGYCDGSASIVNGSGLNGSVAGETVQLLVYLNDIFQYPTFVEVASIQVQIVKELVSYFVQPSIHPIINGTGPTEDRTRNSISQSETAPASPPHVSNTSDGNPQLLANAFNVIYTPEKSGIYEIYVFCGNIVLNGGHPFRKEVKEGEVNISLSGVRRFASKVPKLVENEIVVQLMDSFVNPVSTQQQRLKLEIASVNKSGFASGTFIDNNDGSYSCNYVVKEVGTYEMCVSFDGMRFSPCPFGVNAYSGEYFPKAYDDMISVWEDESIAFDVLSNDYFAGNNASIVEFSEPDRGSLLLCGQLFRYTPYLDYYGNDSFMYTISDINGNLASAAVNISVQNIPPRFISFPSQLQAAEDLLSPRFGGFSGFEMRYSDPTENIFVTLSAQSGTVFLSPMLMQFWQPIWSKFSVKKGGDQGKGLVLEGCIEAVNLALQSVQYLGNDNFSGEDVIRISASNTNGKNNLDVPVYVEPINDPPFINVPKLIVLRNNGDDQQQIFDKDGDNLEVSVGDPDLLNFPGKDSNFIVTFSVEVNDGYLITSLPAELISKTELKLSGHQWQLLQTYVAISKHFQVKANGIRFRGTIDICNSVLQQLSYQGGENDDVLTVKLNDMGHYGCYSDCAERISMPLYVEANIILIRKRPMSSLSSHSLGAAIILEFFVVLSLGGLLLFFTCKCAVLLINERRSQFMPISKLSSKRNSQENTSATVVSKENTSYFTGFCSSPLSFHGQLSSVRQRFCLGSRIKEPDEGKLSHSGYSSGDVLRTSPSSNPLSIEKGHGETV
ncbi:hypothetical protein K2173_017954 [Erythroxylum novogranatense]|uniref:GEX2 N-terminal Ig-like domain-containing protein n=1 Tax=Erythroxylum novogranatense TaxID=1862640 RepID=A0AAV8TXP3_9ROSI|nr:hypothetical protein K2173_017954 [Erythroxylum novogranatense]